MIRDILTVTRRRFPSVDILIAPVRVQGAEAPAEIIRAIGDLQVAAGVDVIILARGGGSLEDLAPFNDEGVARAIARSRIPVISAVGHETDFTIADFTADLRAATPSAAAELAVPLRAELLETVETLRLRLIRRRRQETERLRQRIADLAGRLRDPKRRLADIRIALDDQLERMRISLDHLREVRRQEWINLTVRLEHRNPRSRIAEGLRLVDGPRKGPPGGLGKAGRAAKEPAAARRWRSSISLSPLAVLGRGYSITRRLPDGLILRRAGERPRSGQEVDIRLAAGNLHAHIIRNIRRSRPMSKEKFEEALEKLEEIVRRMEAGEMTLEESLKAFEEGIKLSRLCAKKLDEADRRVELLLRQEGELVTKPFAEEERESVMMGTAEGIPRRPEGADRSARSLIISPARRAIRR